MVMVVLVAEKVLIWQTHPSWDPWGHSPPLLNSPKSVQQQLWKFLEVGSLPGLGL